MVTFSLHLCYDDVIEPRIIAEGCSKEQVIEILSRHIMLARVKYFYIVPYDHYVPFKEYTL